MPDSLDATATVVLAGLAYAFVPKLGVLRALWIAARSRFAINRGPESVRTEELKKVRYFLMEKRRPGCQSSIAVTGSRGVGKTFLVDAATRKTPGVVSLHVLSGTSAHEILTNALLAVTGTIWFSDLRGTAKRVIFWYRLFSLFHHSPIVVLQGNERYAGNRADIGPVVRTLVEEFHLRVLVEGSHDAVDPCKMRTIIFELEPMSKTDIRKLSQLQDFFIVIDSLGLDNMVWAVLGGEPFLYQELWKQVKNSQDPKQTIGTFLCDEILDAIRLVERQAFREPETAKNIKNYDPIKGYVRNGYRPDMDSVFRKAFRDSMHVLVPASNAIEIVLRHGLKRGPNVMELEKLITS